MKIVWLVPDDKLEEVKNKLFSDDITARQSITIRAARSLDFNKDGSYVFLNASEDAIKKAKELVGSSGTVLEDDDQDEVINRIETADEDVAVGFGGIFG